MAGAACPFGQLSACCGGEQPKDHGGQQCIGENSKHLRVGAFFGLYARCGFYAVLERNRP